MQRTMKLLVLALAASGASAFNQRVPPANEQKNATVAKAQEAKKVPEAKPAAKAPAAPVAPVKAAPAKAAPVVSTVAAPAKAAPVVSTVAKPIARHESKPEAPVASGKFTAKGMKINFPSNPKVEEHRKQEKAIADMKQLDGHVEKLFSHFFSDVARRAPMADKKDQDTASQPVNMQVPEEDIKEFLKKLSPDCKTQLNSMLNGENKLDTFGDQGMKTSSENCQKLNGTLCYTAAHINQQRSTDGRDMQMNVDVTGDGCLPKNCMEQEDLGHLSMFMRNRAQDSLPGNGINVNLKVDCTSSGGTSFETGMNGGSVRSSLASLVLAMFGVLLMSC